MQLKLLLQMISPNRHHGLIIGTVLIIVAIVGTNVWVLTQIQQRALQIAQTSLLRQSLTLSESVNRGFQAVDLVLESVVDNIRNSV